METSLAPQASRAMSDGTKAWYQPGCQDSEASFLSIIHDLRSSYGAGKVLTGSCSLSASISRLLPSGSGYSARGALLPFRDAALRSTQTTRKAFTEL